MNVTRRGWIIVEHPLTGAQHSRHVQEREGIESAATLSAQLGLAVRVAYQQDVVVDASAFHDPVDVVTEEWLAWNQTDLAFRDLDEVTFGELR